jgi:hypothetical protein
MHPLVTEDLIESYRRDGVVLIKGLFAEHVETLRKGVQRNMDEPGPYAAENLKAGEGGRFSMIIAIGRALASSKRLRAKVLRPKSQPI